MQNDSNHNLGFKQKSLRCRVYLEHKENHIWHVILWLLFLAFISNVGLFVFCIIIVLGMICLFLYTWEESNETNNEWWKDMTHLHRKQ